MRPLASPTQPGNQGLSSWGRQSPLPLPRSLLRAEQHSRNERWRSPGPLFLEATLRMNMEFLNTDLEALPLSLDTAGAQGAPRTLWRILWEGRLCCAGHASTTGSPRGRHPLCSPSVNSFPAPALADLKPPGGMRGHRAGERHTQLALRSRCVQPETARRGSTVWGTLQHP